MKEKKREKKEAWSQKCKQWLRAIWERIKKIPWQNLILWIWQIPWKTILRCLSRFTRKRVLPLCCFFLCIGILFSVMMLTVSGAVCDKTKARILSEEQLREMGGEFDCIMVLGCRVYDDGRLSHMLEDRVSTGVSLYRAGISKTLLMSGDHQTADYNEVGAMRTAAMEAGVPEEAILTDPAGLSTYDSVARLLRVYKGKRVVIVTQEYHLYRALYIAEKMGIEAYGVSADLRSYSGQFKRDVREVVARCKDVCYALTQPPAAEA